MGKYQIRKSVSNGYYWVLKAPNGEELLRSEDFYTKSDCMESIAVSRVSITDDNFSRQLAPDGTFYFCQISNELTILSKSAPYLSISSRDFGIECVKRNALISLVEEI
jgi:uncharacterized protein YegP (UPF0339 family)